MAYSVSIESFFFFSLALIKKEYPPLANHIKMDTINAILSLYMIISVKIIKSTLITAIIEDLDNIHHPTLPQPYQPN